tara:strand:+ start:129 stop:368 length:240 start_codon:yes stop_codon:yes gene_type:complete
MEIKRIAKQVSKLVLRYRGASVLDRVNSALDLELEGFQDKGIARSLVFKAMTREIYETIFVPIGMTQDGFYTEDKSLWA